MQEVQEGLPQGLAPWQQPWALPWAWASWPQPVRCGTASGRNWRSEPQKPWRCRQCGAGPRYTYRAGSGARKANGTAFSGGFEQLLNHPGYGGDCGEERGQLAFSGILVLTASLKQRGQQTGSYRRRPPSESNHVWAVPTPCHPAASLRSPCRRGRTAQQLQAVKLDAWS